MSAREQIVRLASRCRRSARGSGYVVASAAGIAILAPAPASASTNEASCANEGIRAEQASTYLPDCRAYELVSPPGSIPAGVGVAAAGGGRVAYHTNQPYPGSDATGLYLLATRGPTGWSVENDTPSQGGIQTSDLIACTPSVFYSLELTRNVLVDGARQYGQGGEERECEGDNPPLVPGEPRGYANVFLHNGEGRSYQLLDALPPGEAPENAVFRDATPELSHVVFSEKAKLTPEAPKGEDLYEWSGGALRLVSILPNKEAVPGKLANASHGSATFTHALSANGETVIFEGNERLYARRNAEQQPGASGECRSEPARACTVEVDAAEAGAPGPSGGATFLDASAEGTRVFFMDKNRLTRSATSTPLKADLYEYDLETETLTDLTVSTGGHAQVLGFSGASENASYLYFVADGVLSEVANSYGEKALAGYPNLYLLHSGRTSFIATLDGESPGVNGTPESAVYQAGGEGFPNDGELTARTSPNGEYIAFASAEALTGYDNKARHSEECEGREGCREVFLYSAAAGRLTCVSCGARRQPPAGEAQMKALVKETDSAEPPTYLQRSVLDSGTVYFETPTPLSPRATNGATNVYEWEGGKAHLISGGQSPGGAEFLDASASGEEVFFSTGQALVASDTDNMPSVYDARVEGGFQAKPGQGAQAGSCESEEACKPPPAEAPAEQLAASRSFAGPGDLVSPPAGPPPHRKGTSRGTRGHARQRKLAKALKLCRRRPRSTRRACEAQARRRFGAARKRRAGHGGGTRRRRGDGRGKTKRGGAR
ncbi:MAG: hypothetical protein ACYCUM_13995 [Solirubrobacteraceae bacterium]